LTQAGREELLSGVVFRLARRSEQELFIADRRVPLPDDFNLGSGETETAKARSFAQLSVWDEQRATVDQAREFLSPPYRAAFWLSVSDIRQIVQLQTDDAYLRVFRDPEARPLPGANGHCVVENVWPSKSDFRRIRADLISVARANRADLGA
jgi:hypothetical protein